MSIRNRKALRDFIEKEARKILIECGCKEKSYEIPSFPYEGDHEIMSRLPVKDHMGSRKYRSSVAMCPGSYLAASDEMVANPEIVMNILDPIMQKTGAECPQSIAMALSDIIELLTNHEEL